MRRGCGWGEGWRNWGVDRERGEEVGRVARCLEIWHPNPFVAGCYRVPASNSSR